MSSVALRKFILILLLLTVWGAGSSLVSRAGLWNSQEGTTLASLDCCRISPLTRNEGKFSCGLLPRVHSGDEPCCDPPLRTPCRLTAYQRPDSPLPQNPVQPAVSLLGRRHRLFAASGTGFSPLPGPSSHFDLALLKTVVLLN
jgi:hypothetical protein